jgi:hypothetical protein
MRPMIWFFCMVLSALLTGCGQKPVLTEVLTERMEVLEAPSPLWYGSPDPHKNRVIATLRRGERFYLRGEDFGKDYKYFEVLLMSGKKGYVIYEGGGLQFRKVEGKE